MNQIKTTIATTLPDQTNSKFTKNVLKKLRDRINTAVPSLPVQDLKGNDIGIIKEGTVSENKLVVSLEIDTSGIDKNWEYFFVPVLNRDLESELQGKFSVIMSCKIEGVKMVRNPHDLSLKPVRFEIKIKEGVDYHIKRYDEIELEDILSYQDKLVPVYVYYPIDFGVEDVIKDAEQRGFISIDGEKQYTKTPPFEISAWPNDFDHYKRHIKKLWQKFNLMTKENPLKNLTKMQSLG